MNAPRSREWPRATIAIGLAAVVLVVIGALITSAASGGSTKTITATVSTTTPAPSASRQAARLDSDQRTIATLRGTVAHQRAQLSRARRALVRSRPRVAELVHRAKRTKPSRR